MDQFAGLHYIPIFLFILFPFTFLGTYLTAVWLGHVEPNFPYISDAASYSPESCVFGQLINIGAVLLGILVYILYCVICQLNISNPRVAKLNKCGLWFGMLSCIGLSIVANFQETNVRFVHLFGATLCFGMGSAYFWVQMVCSYILQSVNIWVSHVRVGLSVVSTIFFFIASICGWMSHLQYDGHDPTKWKPDDGGWLLHVISTASEWVVAICFCFYILTLYSEFSRTTITHPLIHTWGTYALQSSNDNASNSNASNDS